MAENVLIKGEFGSIIGKNESAKKRGLVFLFIGLAMYIVAIVLTQNKKDEIGIFAGLLAAIIFLIAIISVISANSKLKYYRSARLTVTQSMVSGSVYKDRSSVNLPIDMISSVSIGKYGKIESLDVRTSSGVVQFTGLDNCDEVCRCISNLIIVRQQNKQSVSIEQVAPVSSADELKKFKELLDSGAITQEEFDAKKKQLLS